MRKSLYLVSFASAILDATVTLWLYIYEPPESKRREDAHIVQNHSFANIIQERYEGSQKYVYINEFMYKEYVYL